MNTMFKSRNRNSEQYMDECVVGSIAMYGNVTYTQSAESRTIDNLICFNFSPMHQKKQTRNIKNGTVFGRGSRLETCRAVIDSMNSKCTENLPEREADHLGKIVGKSQKIKTLHSFCRKAASCDATVLIDGDTGTGKELVAKTIHLLSNRSEGPFITIDCGSIPKELIESELFGHEKGSFTGAQNQRKGAFERGHNGTVFLDEIGELPMDMQPKLLRILEERKFKRIGGGTHIPVDIRVIAATNRKLNVEVMKGNFREDLFFRLYVIPLSLPTLRERGEDILLLADNFLKRHPLISEKDSQITISEVALKKMSAYSWPGNVRELRNVIERAIINSDGRQISDAEIQFSPVMSEREKSLTNSPTSLEEIEKQAIVKALKAQEGNKKATAKALSIAYSTMCQKVTKYNIKI